MGFFCRGVHRRAVGPAFVGSERFKGKSGTSVYDAIFLAVGCVTHARMGTFRLLPAWSPSPFNCLVDLFVHQQLRGMVASLA